MEEPREAVEFWRGLGFNVIPAPTQQKVVRIAWQELIPPNNIPDEQYGEWYRNGAFSNGMAIMLGKVYNHPINKNSESLYGIGIDCDNQSGIDLVLYALGYKTISEASRHVIVEQHRDQKYKAHFIIYSHRELPKKGTYIPPTEGDNLDMKEPPRVEIKGTGQLLFVSPSIHKDGYPYEIPKGGTMQPEILNGLQEHFEDAFKKYGMSYANNGVTTTDNNGIEIGLNEKGEIPMEILFDPDTKIYEGDRHHELIRVANALLFRNQNLLEEYKVRELVEGWNKDHCIPPLYNKEVESIWKSTKKFVIEVNKERAYHRHLYQERLKAQAEQDEWLANEQSKNEQKNPLPISKLARLNEEGKLHYAAGKLTSFGPLYFRVRSGSSICSKCGNNKTYLFPHPVTAQEYHLYAGNVSAMCSFVFGGTCDGIVRTTPEWVSSINVEVSDDNTLQDTDRLKYVLFGSNTENVGVGENATILAIIYMETPKKGGATFPVAYAQKIIYENREEEDLRPAYIEGIRRFRKMFSDNEMIKQLVSMMACNIYGLNNVKEGILYMAANAKPMEENRRKKNKEDERRERLHGALIGPPGLGKSSLLRYARDITSKSTMETCQTSTALSLLIIVDNEGDMKMVRLGPVASSLFAALDEFNTIPISAQLMFLGLMEEGRLTSNKFGRRQEIFSAPTILTSMNPPEGTNPFLANGKIDLSIMNIAKPVLDRMDLKWYIKDDDVDFDKITDTRVYNMDRKAVNYAFLIKNWIKYAQRFNPKLSLEARLMLDNAVRDLKKINPKLSPRVIDRLFNIAKARARILLKHTIDTGDARAAIIFYNEMAENYENETIAPRDVIDVAIEECYKLLSEIIAGETLPYTIKELLQNSAKNQQVWKYISSGVAKEDYFDIRNNKQARNVYEALLKRHPEIVKVSEKPIRLMIPKDKVLCDSSDLCDRDRRDPLTKKIPDLSVNDTKPKTEIVSSEREKTQNSIEGGLESRSHRSHRSHSRRNRRQRPIGELHESKHKYQCPKCDYKSANPSKITEHMEELHKDSSNW